MKEIKDMNEKELREFKVPWFKTEKELHDFIEQLTTRKHDYGTCVYAMSLAAVATFRYVSGKLGVTGFQASCADMNFIERTRRLERFSISDYSKLLYPQYVGNKEHFPDAEYLIEKNKDWLKEKANELLKNSSDSFTHPDVLKHWKMLSKL